MGEDFDKTVFSFYFNGMLYLGFWVTETPHRAKRLLYAFYSNAMTLWVLFMSYMGILDLVHCVPHINRIVYNVCINIFIIGTLIKFRLTMHNSRRINFLRRKLHRDLATCKDAQELRIYANAIKDFNIIVRLFFTCMVLLYPTWLVLNFFGEYWGKRELPLPSRWPSDIDITDSKVFFSMSVFHAVFAGCFLLQAAVLDSSMFGLLVQIYREYRFLIKKINEFGELCEEMYREESGGKKAAGENVILRKVRVKHTLGRIIGRQKNLFEFSEDFEHSYNVSMFVHIFAGGTLLCVNGIQAMILSFDFSVKIAYQFGYVLIILADILYLCWLTSRISKKCFEVGNAFYGIPWYKLDLDVQKDICFVILRSQKPPRITSGNFVELNLRTSMLLLKNIYSWLALFRQVALK